MSSTTANAGAGAKETLDAETLMKMTLVEMIQKGIDPCAPKVKSLVEEYYKAHFGKEEDEVDDEDEDEEEEEKDEGDEAGLMDYRGDVTAVEKDRRITIILNFAFNETDDCLLPIPEDFEEKWCASYNPREIAEDAIGEDYTILDAFWSGTKLHILVDNLDESLNVDEIINDLESNSLEDAQYEAAPGDGFWVISYGDLQKAIAE